MKISIYNKNFLINKILEYASHLVENKNDIVLNFIERYDDEDRFCFHLPVGEHNIKYQNETINIIYKKSDTLVGTSLHACYYEEVVLETEGDINLLKKFFQDAHDYCKVKNTKENIITHIFKSGHWSILSKLPRRDISTVYLPKKVMDDIIMDMEQFINREDVYNKLGIPYKRNYMFSGLPGTGKTTLIYSLASKFNFDVSLISFNLNLDDGNFMRAVSKLPKKSFLVLEDIDNLFVERKAGDTNKSMVTFSGVLNILDGLARNYKQITFLTTNYINKLDFAIIRPGRVDKILNFTYATIFQIHNIFDRFFPDEKILWKEFKKKVIKIKTTIAIIQTFFLKYIDNPKGILDDMTFLKKMTSEINKENKLLYI